MRSTSIDTERRLLAAITIALAATAASHALAQVADAAQRLVRVGKGGARGVLGRPHVARGSAGVPRLCSLWSGAISVTTSPEQKGLISLILRRLSWCICPPKLRSSHADQDPPGD